MSDWDDLDSDQQWARIRQGLESFAGFATGKVTDDREDNSQMHFTGTYLQRPFRLIVDSDGQPELKVKVKARPECIDVIVYFERDAVPVVKEADAVWDEPDADVKEFLAAGVYLEGSKDRIADIKTRMGTITNPIVQLLQGANANRFEINGDGEIEITWPMDVNIAKINFATYLQPTLDVVEQIAREIQ